MRQFWKRSLVPTDVVNAALNRCSALLCRRWIVALKWVAALLTDTLFIYNAMLKNPFYVAMTPVNPSIMLG